MWKKFQRPRIDTWRYVGWDGEGFDPLEDLGFFYLSTLLTTSFAVVSAEAICLNRQNAQKLQKIMIQETRSRENNV